jgi:hypothetical protein
MKTLSVLAIVVFLGFCLVPGLDAASQSGRGRDRVCIYQDIQYQGWEQCYSPGDEVANLDKRNNAISSIRIYGRAQLTVYEDTDFRGHSVEFSSDVPDLGLRVIAGSKSWSDHIESLRVSPDSATTVSRRDRDRDRNEEAPGDGICVYERAEYQGRSECWNADNDVRDLTRAGNWSDKISSIRVFGRTQAVFYRDIDLRGEHLTVDHDIPDLAQVSMRGFGNWNDQISSLLVEAERGRRRARR